MEPREEAAAKQKFHQKMDAAIDDMVKQVKSNLDWEEATDNVFMEMFDAVVSNETETEIQIGEEVARRLDKPYPFE